MNLSSRLAGPRPKAHKNDRRVRPALEALEDRNLPSTLSGVVFSDANNNGVVDPGEAGVAGVTVKLTGINSQNQSVNLTQTTDANGAYSFGNLLSGTYAVRVLQPSAYLNGLAAAGSDGGSASAGAVSNIVLNGDGAGYNFGELARADGWTAIQSNFNGTTIAAGSTVWFSSVLKASGLGSGPVTLHFTNQTITFTANGAPVTVAVPDSTVTFSPTTTAATTTFDASTNSWVTNLPMQFSGNGFLSGVALPAPNGLPGGINPVTWQGQVTSDTAGVSVNWQWAAAVYKSFGTDYNALNVKPVDDNHASAYQNSDHAGTPEAFTAFVTGGARGGGGSNFTGSLSPTVTISPPKAQQPANLSGFVLDQATGAPLGGVTVTLSYTNAQGQTVTFTTTTDNTTGAFKFTNLPPGTYTLTATPPQGEFAASDQAGNLGGTPLDAQTIGGINLPSGAVGVDYDFFESPFQGS